MTVPVGWTTHGVIDLKLPLPREDAQWPIKFTMTVNSACLVVDTEAAVRLHVNALAIALSKISGIEPDDSTLSVFRNQHGVVFIEVKLNRTVIAGLVAVGGISGNNSGRKIYAPIRYKD